MSRFKVGDKAVLLMPIEHAQSGTFRKVGSTVKVLAFDNDEIKVDTGYDRTFWVQEFALSTLDQWSAIYNAVIQDVSTNIKRFGSHVG